MMKQEICKKTVCKNCSSVWWQQLWSGCISLIFQAVLIFSKITLAPHTRDFARNGSENPMGGRIEFSDGVTVSCTTIEIGLIQTLLLLTKVLKTAFPPLASLPPSVSALSRPYNVISRDFIPVPFHSLKILCKESKQENTASRLQTYNW